MSDEKRETVDDIVAEMREIADNPECVAPTGLRHMADRLEAAAKREAQAIATENAVLPAVCITTKPSGDAAALREALTTIRDKAHEAYVNDNGIDTVWIQDVANAALAAPPRNCDRYADYQAACIAWSHARKPKENMLDGYDFAVWLFNSAEEKGENSGDK